MSEHQKLSTLMRIGAAKYPQGYGEYAQYDDDDNICSVCAMGAALVAANHDAMKNADPGSFDAWSDAFEALEALTGLFLVDEKFSRTHVRPLTIDEVIIDMNDSGKFTITEIADWLDSIGY